MKDSLSALFRQRFQGHEAPVGASAWQGIQAKLGAGAATDGLSDLLKKRFAEHEVMVDPAVWQGVSGQLGHGVGGFSAGGAIGWVAAGVAGIVVVGGLLFTLSSDGGNAADNEQLVLQPEQVRVDVMPEAVAKPVAETTGPDGTDIEPAQIAPTMTPVRKAGVEVRHQETNTVLPRGGRTQSAKEKFPVSVADPAPVVKSQPPPGAAVVDEIIAEITQQVQTEVRSSPEPPSRPISKAATSAGVDPVETAIEHGSVAEPPAQKPFMPNTFTPNNDGNNDTYVVPMVGYTSMLLRVYSLKDNRLVFSTNTGEPWTGANCEDGMYLVAVEAMTPSGQMVSEGKVVWLNRNTMN